MMFDLNTLIIILGLCSQSFSYFNYFQIMTGIDVMSLLINNQLSTGQMNLIINFVNTQLQNIASEITLSDSDLWELLKYVIEESGNGNIISADLLVSMGLYTNSILAYLNAFGFIIQ